MNTVVSISQLEAQLQHFDGKHMDSLRRVAERLLPDSSTIDQLISLAERSDAPMQIAATWLIEATFSPEMLTSPRLR